MIGERATSAAPVNRWTIAVAGVVMQLILGTVYAWSVFKKPFMAAHGWSNQEVGLTFTLIIFFLGLAAAFGGRFVDKAGARRVATLAAVLFGTGTVLAGVADAIGSLPLLYVGYGVLGGIGNGLGYITPIAVLVRWFPDKRGLITGLAVMGFGFGAAVLGQIAPFMIPKVVTVEGVLQVSDPGLGLSASFCIFGVVFMALLLLAARFLNNPPEGWTPPAGSRKVATVQAGASVDLRGALRMPQFYILWSILFINVTAGMALISNLSPLAQVPKEQNGCGATAIVAGTVMFVSSLFNGFGRIFWAWLSDRLGRQLVFALILCTQIPVLLFLPRVTNVGVFTVMAGYVLLCMGGGFATMPAYAADTFGSRNMGSIYGKILLAWSMAGVLGPMVMETVFKRTRSFSAGLSIAAGLLAVGFVVNLFYRKPTPAAAA